MLLLKVSLAIEGLKETSCNNTCCFCCY